MDELFEQLERGEVPSFIEIMAAISEISDLWPTDVCLDCRSSQGCDSALEDAPESI